VAQRLMAGAAAAQPAVYEPIGYQSLGYRAKKVLLGRPLPTSRLVHERLRKLVALAVFSSDAISSTAYGTEQIMLSWSLPGRWRPGWRSRSRWGSVGCWPC
jgi:hypothetical protein